MSMFRPSNINTALLLSIAVKGAGALLKDRDKLSELVGTASINLDSGKRKLASVKSDLLTLLSLIKAWARGEYKEVSRTTLLMSAGAVIYFVNPLDAIPDVLPASGLLDDATVIGVVIASIKKDIEKFRVWESDYAGFSAPAPT